MPLAADTQLGPYRIQYLVGAGGMGEVYRARDTRLNRDVAVKILNESFASDPERLRRFELEAQSTGALNHPNIVGVYDVGAHQGLHYIVSELLEGESLRQRLRGGKIATQKALEYARQVASGLAAAHAKGITHRDLKPENIFVTGEGRVKILDFGLAKLRQEQPAQSMDDTAETRGLETTPGVVMGTAAYMAPEQVRGHAADHRSDIFSFGCVLFEMLAGRRAFQADSAVETMSAILKQEPPDLTSIDSALPPALDRIVRHCLEKNPEERFQSARDLAFDLDSLSHASGRIEQAPVRKRGRTLWAAAAVLILAAVAAAAYYSGARGGQSTYAFARLTYRRGVIALARFSPDGSSLVYGARWEDDPSRVFTGRFDNPESQMLGFSDTGLLSVSSAGELAVLLKPREREGFITAGMLARVTFSGGAREILDGVQWADWAPDGKDLAVVRDSEKGNQLEFPIGKVLYRSSGFVSHPRFAPDGSRIAFLDHPLRGDDGGFVAVVDMNGEKKNLAGPFSSSWGVAWRSPQEVWVAGAAGGQKREIFSVTLSGVQRRVFGQTGTLTLHDIARDGRVLLANEGNCTKLIYYGADKKERDLSWLDWTGASDISPDGKTVLFLESGEGSGKYYSCYVRKTDGSPAIKLGNGRWPVLSPDGKSVLAAGVQDHPETLVIFPIGAGETRYIPVKGFNVVNAYWLPSGSGIVFVGNEAGHGLRLYAMNLDGGPPRPFSPEGMRRTGVTVRPDGKAATGTDITGVCALYPIDGGARETLPGIEPGEIPARWSADGSTLFVYQRGSLPARVTRVDVKTGRREPWTEITPADRAGVTGVSSIRLTPDGQYYAYSVVQRLSELHLVDRLK
jgi:hypothetical protein